MWPAVASRPRRSGRRRWPRPARPGRAGRPGWRAAARSADSAGAAGPGHWPRPGPRSGQARRAIQRWYRLATSGPGGQVGRPAGPGLAPARRGRTTLQLFSPAAARAQAGWVFHHGGGDGGVVEQLAPQRTQRRLADPSRPSQAAAGPCTGQVGSAVGRQRRREWGVRPGQALGSCGRVPGRLFHALAHMRPAPGGAFGAAPGSAYRPLRSSPASSPKSQARRFHAFVDAAPELLEPMHRDPERGHGGGVGVVKQRPATATLLAEKRKRGGSHSKQLRKVVPGRRRRASSRVRAEDRALRIRRRPSSAASLASGAGRSRSRGARRGTPHSFQVDGLPVGSRCDAPGRTLARRPRSCAPCGSAMSMCGRVKCSTRHTSSPAALQRPTPRSSISVSRPARSRHTRVARERPGARHPAAGPCAWAGDSRMDAPQPKMRWPSGRARSSIRPLCTAGLSCSKVGPLAQQWRRARRRRRTPARAARPGSRPHRPAPWAGAPCAARGRGGQCGPWTDAERVWDTGRLMGRQRSRRQRHPRRRA